MDLEEAAQNVGGGQNVIDEILQDVVIPPGQDRQPGTSAGVDRADLPDVSSIILLCKNETFLNESIALKNLLENKINK
jgi:hypothetical protein